MKEIRKGMVKVREERREERDKNEEEEGEWKGNGEEKRG